MKVIKIIFSFFLTIVLFAVGFVAGVAVDVFYLNKIETETISFNDSWVTDSVITDSELSIHFLELGNHYVGDCVYIKCGENDILIDAGSRNDSATRIIEYVDNFVNDNTLEYVIATHAHEDHIAGFYDESGRKGIFSHYQVENIIDFPNTNKTNLNPTTTVIGKYYAARDAEVALGATHYTALECYNNKNGATRIIQLSETVELEVLYNYYYDHSYSTGENNFSVCVMLNHGENHYLFTGDLESAGEKKLVTYYKDNHGGLPKCTLYKAGHHGSGTSSCPELLEAIDPDYICICTCAGTSEYTDNKDNQFPYQSFIDNVAPYTDKVFVTTMVDNYVDSGWSSNGTVKSMNGDIVCYFNNNQINFRFSNNSLLLKDTDWFKENRVCPDQWK